jgi:hypothetical protein
MSKRIFTKVFVGKVSVETPMPAEVSEVAWLAQEDIEVIGAEICVLCTAPSENDGYSHCAVELSQTGVFAADGSILKASASEGWNTTPAGIALANANVAATFPAGYVVPVKEEGYLYVNTESAGKTAGICVYDYNVVVYYTKKGGR